MKLSEIKVGDKVRLKLGVENTQQWVEHLDWWDKLVIQDRILATSTTPRPVLTVVCTDGDLHGSGDVCVHGPGGPRCTWLRSEWLEPVEAEPPAEAPSSTRPDAIGLRLGGFVAVNRVTSIDLTSDQLVELVATSFGSKPKAGTMSIGTTREEGVLKTFNLRWQEQAPGGDS